MKAYIEEAVFCWEVEYLDTYKDESKKIIIALPYSDKKENKIDMLYVRDFLMSNWWRVLPSHNLNAFEGKEDYEYLKQQDTKMKLSDNVTLVLTAEITGIMYVGDKTPCVVNFMSLP